MTFRKLTLLFAENGRGKTTLCAILRSLQTGQHEFIAERKTLGTSDPPSLQIRLGDFISKIRNANDTDGLSHAKADLVEIEAINGFSKKYHHDQNPNADSETISDNELHGFVKRTLRLVGGD